MHQLRTDLDTPDQLSLTMDHSHSIMDLLIETSSSLSVMVVQIFMIFISVYCLLHSPNHKNTQNKLFRLVMPIVTPFRSGRIQKESYDCLSIIILCATYVLMLKILINTCTLNMRLSKIENNILIHIVKLLNLIKSFMNVLKNAKIRSRPCNRKLNVYVNTRNCKNRQAVSMIMIIFRKHRHGHKVTTIKTLEILTLHRCQLNVCSYTDAVYPKEYCYHLTGINVRLICLLIRINSNFELSFSLFLAVTYLCCLVFILTRSSTGSVRFIPNQNRTANHILKLREQPKTETRNYTRKNGRCNTSMFLKRVCKLKFENLRKMTSHRYKNILYLTTLIIHLSRINSTLSEMKAKSMKKKQQLGTPNIKIQAKNHDHVYRGYYNLYLTPCNTDG